MLEVVFGDEGDHKGEGSYFEFVSFIFVEAVCFGVALNDNVYELLQFCGD